MRAHTLYQDADITLARYDHEPDIPHRDPSGEESEGYAVSFVERGSFDVHHRRGAWRLGPRSLFVTRPGLRYRCAHDSDLPDDVCLSLHCSAEFLEDAVGKWPELVPVAPLSNRLAYLNRQLGSAIEDGVGSLAVPALARQIVEALSASPSKLHRAGQLAWYAERIDAARDLIERRYAEPLTLATLGREVGISPFHLSRVFRELVGMPPHRYLVRVRLERAAERLREGFSVTETALEAGFGNLSHFVRQFRRAHGVSPSRYARK